MLVAAFAPWMEVTCLLVSIQAWKDVSIQPYLLSELPINKIKVSCPSMTFTHGGTIEILSLLCIPLINVDIVASPHIEFAVQAFSVYCILHGVFLVR